MILFNFPRAEDGAHSGQLSAPSIGSWYPPPSFRGGPRGTMEAGWAGQRAKLELLRPCLSVLSARPHSSGTLL